MEEGKINLARCLIFGVNKATPKFFRLWFFRQAHTPSICQDLEENISEETSL